MNKKITLLIILLLGKIEYSNSQYTFYDCSNDTIVLGRNTEFNEFEEIIYGIDTNL